MKRATNSSPSSKRPRRVLVAMAWRHGSAFLAHNRLSISRLHVTTPASMPVVFIVVRRASPESVDENGDENGKRVGESHNRPPFSSPFSFTDATVACV